MSKLKTWHVVLIMVVVVIAIAVLLFGKNIKAVLMANQQPDKPANTPQPAQLDYNKNLYKGINNSPEVKLLQQWLGVNTDGDFGPVTEQALKSRKGVTQTTLNQYQQLPDAQQVANNESGAKWYNYLPFPFSFFSLTEENLMQPGINNSIEWS